MLAAAAGKLWTLFGERMADKCAEKLMLRMEQENALPLPALLYDVVVDDPEMAARHEYLALEAISPLAARIAGYRRAMRDEGFRCVHGHPPGDETTLSVADEASIYATVHLAGDHPAIDYAGPRRTNVTVR